MHQERATHFRRGIRHLVVLTAHRKSCQHWAGAMLCALSEPRPEQQSTAQGTAGRSPCDLLSAVRQLLVAGNCPGRRLFDGPQRPSRAGRCAHRALSLLELAVARSCSEGSGVGCVVAVAEGSSAWRIPWTPVPCDPAQSIRTAARESYNRPQRLRACKLSAHDRQSRHFVVHAYGAAGPATTHRMYQRAAY
jgi:hypothetical protein